MFAAVESKIKDPELKKAILEWFKWDKNEDTVASINSLLNNNDIDKLKKLLLNRLTFGTAGLRGVMGPGYAAMNDLVIIQTTQGLLSYLEATEPEITKRGVVIGFDSRHNSEKFAKLTAITFIQKGIPVHLFSEITPTPFVPFTVCLTKCAAGIMITASHNPKEDNGYKVFWSNFAQIIPPHDIGIQEHILKNLEPSPLAWDTSLLDNMNLCRDPLAEAEAQYFNAISENVFDRETNIRCPIIFTHSSMHGVAHRFIMKAFTICGFQHFVPVEKQMIPDPDFPTVKFPNPEEGKSALTLAFETAEKCSSSVILANDPDGDRLAVAELLPNGKWKVFTGNEIGALLGWWLWFCYNHKNSGTSASDVYMISSAVSSKILETIAEKEGFNFTETLTGFKWMCNKAYELMKKKKTILFAFEEAIGFMCGTTVLDKDGIGAAMQMAQLAAYAYAEKKTLVEKLKEIYRRYGFHVCMNSYFICNYQPAIMAMFKKLRNYEDSGKYPKALDSYKIKGIRDLTTGYDDTQPSKKAVLPISDSSQMITFYFENGCVATLRTSGTEPKIKYYTELRVKADESEWPSYEALLKDIVDLIIKHWIQPDKNGFISKD